MQEQEDQAARARNAQAGQPLDGVDRGVPTKIPDEVVKEYREMGLTVTSVGSGLYIVNVPHDPQQHHVQVTETEPPIDAPGTINWLPGSNTPMTTPVGTPASQSGGAPDPGSATAPPEQPQLSVEAGKIVTGVGSKVDALVNKSPTLQKHLKEFLANGGEIDWGEVGVGGTASKGKSGTIIYLDASLKSMSPDKIASVLSHEIGHVRKPPAQVSTIGLSEEQYVNRRVDSFLDSEGAGIFENARAWDEIALNGGHSSIAGIQPDERYSQIYYQHKLGLISEEQATHQMGQIAGDGELSGGSKVLYRDQYIEEAQQEWARDQEKK